MSSHKVHSGALQPESLISVGLDADDLRALPEALREQCGVLWEGPSGDWTLVGTRDTELAQLVRRVLARLEPMAAMHRRRLSERNIDLLLESILSDTPRDDIHAVLEMDNAKLRADYVEETRLLTGAEVRAASGLSPKNASEPASRWKREGRVFAVRHAGRDLYPAFEFADGQPRLVIKQILAVMPSSATPWQIALWFASGNGWLDGAEPRACLDATDEVVEAARDFANPVEG